MLRQGYNWDEIGSRLGNVKPEALKKTVLALDAPQLPVKAPINLLHSPRPMP